MAAISVITDTHNYVLKKSNIPSDLIDFWHETEVTPMPRKDNVARFKNQYKSITDFLHYTKKYQERFSGRYFDEVETDLIAVTGDSLRRFYGNRFFSRKYHGMYNQANANRMKDAAALPLQRTKDIIDVCSGGMWVLKKKKNGDHYIIQKTLDMESPLDVILTNMWIARNTSLVTKMNSMNYYD